MVHYGQAAEGLDRRGHTLHAAYPAHLERFVSNRPALLPAAVWINPPTPSSDAQEEELPKTVGSQKPNSPSAHPRSGCPSSSCVPAEFDSVSADNRMLSESTSPAYPRSGARAMPENIPGAWGWPPHPNRTAREASPHYTNFNSQVSQTG